MQIISMTTNQRWLVVDFPGLRKTCAKVHSLSENARARERHTRLIAISTLRGTARWRNMTPKDVLPLRGTSLRRSEKSVSSTAGSTLFHSSRSETCIYYKNL